MSIPGHVNDAIQYQEKNIASLKLRIKAYTKEILELSGAVCDMEDQVSAAEIVIEAIRNSPFCKIEEGKNG